MREPVPSVGPARIEGNGAPKLALGARPVPVVLEFDVGEGSMRLSQPFIQRERLQCRATCFGKGFGRRRTLPQRPAVVSVGQAGVGARVLGVPRNDLLEALDRFLEGLGSAFGQEIATPQVGEKDIRARSAGARLRWTDISREPRRHRSPYPLLDDQNVMDAAFVRLRPNAVSGARIDELSVNSYRVASDPRAPFQYGRHIQEVADLAHVLVLPSELKRRCACCYNNPVQPHQVISELLTDAIADVIVGRVTAEVRERQHSNRSDGRGTQNVPPGSSDRLL